MPIALVNVGTAAAQAAITAYQAGPEDGDALVGLLGVVQLLDTQADSLSGTSNDDLLAAYKAWLKAAYGYFAGQASLRTYALAAAMLNAEVQLDAAVPDDQVDGARADGGPETTA